MIQHTTGNLLEANTEALVNTVNTVGVMGKGIALQFKNRFPHNYKVYKDACKREEFTTGQVLMVEDGDLMDKRKIINFPTKKHWKGNSKYEYIETGLVALRELIEREKIKSIAIPPLGCGHGGLDWEVVREMITKALGDLDCEINLYTPNPRIKEQLQKSETKKEAKLSPARAMLLYLLFQYEAVGDQSSLFVTNKLAYFLQRKGEKLKLTFEPHHYGPYSVQLNHVMQYLNGRFLKGLEQNVAKPFDPIYLNYDRYQEIDEYIQSELSAEQLDRLSGVLRLIQRFESTYALELLATVDYAINESESKDLGSVSTYIQNWSNRKSNLFKQEHIKIAYDHLHNYGQEIFVS